MRGNRSWRTDWRSASVRSQGGRSDGDRQLFEYAFHAGAPLALLTNGVIWRFYSTFSAGTYAERLVRNLDIETEPPDEVAAALDRDRCDGQFCRPVAGQLVAAYSLVQQEQDPGPENRLRSCR